MVTRSYEVDVLVVGAGNAAACAALAARDQGATVMMLESAGQADKGGNSTYTAGAMRFAYDGVEDIASIVPEVADSDLDNIDYGSYSEDAFFDDMFRVTRYRTDSDLVELLVRNSRSTMQWMREQGVKFQTSQGRQAFKVDGKYQFWGGLVCEVWGGGPGLVEMLHAAAVKKQIDILYETLAVGLLHDDGGVYGVRVRQAGATRDIHARAVVLACGGFESNAEMRARYLGPNWDLAKVRGTRHNTGEGIRMALEIGAMPYGHWSGAHAVGWDVNAPAFGDLAVGDSFQKHSYPFGIMVNAMGDRFVDEGADFRNFTYAKYGQEILAQPGMFAWQVFDGKVLHLLRDEYKIREITKVQADTLEGLAETLEAQHESVSAAHFLETVDSFNRSINADNAFNPNVKDGRGTRGLPVPKSNWANPIDTPPFEAYSVTCGITFTFGGLKISNQGEVEMNNGDPINGLFAAGEIVGGLFYYNYPGGTGLTSGSVFGKIAGEGAAECARRRLGKE